MDTPAVHDRNADQAAYWNGPAGQRWIDRQETLDIVLGPVSKILFDRARVAHGERVIDVGCGWTKRTGAGAIPLPSTSSATRMTTL